MRENKPLAEAILRQPGQGVGLIFLQERKGWMVYNLGIYCNSCSDCLSYISCDNVPLSQ
jgi:hypothetical protein